MSTTDCATSGTVSSRPTRAAAAAYAGTPGVTSHGTPACVEPLGLLGHRGVHRRVARDQPHDLETVTVGRDQPRHDLVEVEVLGVDQVGVGADVHEEPLVEVGPGIEHDVRLGQQRRGAQREQVGGTGTGADEVDRHRVTAHIVTARAGVQPVKEPIGAACSTE